jgi:hypothetical protein
LPDAPGGLLEWMPFFPLLILGHIQYNPVSNNNDGTAMISTNPTGATHTWRFFRAGGFDQVHVDSGADLLALAQLDQKLWLALSCPTRGIEFDADTLALIDSDHDGHIRAPEIIAAVQWAAALLRDADQLVQGADSIPLTSINDDVPEGRYLLAAARRILDDAGKQEAESISLADAATAADLLSAMRFNGDGVITPETAEDAGLQATIGDIMASCGTVKDRSGTEGINEDIAGKFFAQAQDYSDWWRQAEGDGEIWFLGENTLAARDVYRSVRAKVEDFFTRCRMVAFDERAGAPLSRAVEDFQAMAGSMLDMSAEAIAAFPLAAIGAEYDLPLLKGVNPAWMSALRELHRQVVVPLFGDKAFLSAEQWESLEKRFTATDAWLAGKPQTDVEKLGIARARAILEGDSKAAILDLIFKDKELENEANALAEVERLLRYCRDLHLLINNFVSFRNFYTGKGKAMFQAGTLYLDSRSCELCVRVDDIGKHAALANLSEVYLAYCECIRDGGAEKMWIAAAITAGNSDQLMAGRNGVFYDRQGKDWDATVVRILDHPVSVRQAFWSPYKHVVKMISQQIQKFAASKSQAAEDKMLKAADAAHKPGDPKQPAPAFDVAKFAGIFAAIGLAVGALGTALASVLTGLLGLPWWQLPIAMLGLLLLVSGPAMLIAWFKLKQRNLGPILDANGWAINTRARINIPFGVSLTGVAKLPEGAGHLLVDPYAEKSQAWRYLLALLLVLFLVVWAIMKMGN